MIMDIGPLSELDISGMLSEKEMEVLMLILSHKV